MKLKLIFIILLLSLNIFCYNKQEIHWDWKSINTSNLYFPENFLFGFGTSEYQVSGKKHCPQSNWANFEDKKNFLEKSGDACDHWNQYQKDIELISNLKGNAYRFSLEWSKIEPFEGQFNQEAINHYHKLIDMLISKKITPMVTLHHFTHPQWFEEKKAFESKKNIPIFVNFCKRMFKEFGHKVPFWCTINEPGVYAFQAYVRGVFPPGQTANFHKAGIVSRNLILAHTEIYKELKAMPNGEKNQIGIVHNIFQFEPFKPESIIENKISKYVNRIFHDAITQFLITGKFLFKVPLFANIQYKYKGNIKSTLDFIGLNYYSHVLFNKNDLTRPAYRDWEIQTDMPYSSYAEGIYRAICQVSKIGVPIYITENGIADAKDDRRELFIKQYLYATSKAIKDGYDVRGYFYWSLLDNFEWDMGFSKKFGICEVDSKTKIRKLRKSSEYIKRVYEKFQKPKNTGLIEDIINYFFSKN